MKNIFSIFILLSAMASAQLNVVASYPYLGKIVKAVGGENVRVKVLASPKFDPHFIIPKPSLIPAIARADMLIANGAGLETGWLSPLIKSANNPQVQIGAKGFVYASHAVKLIDKPKSVSRAYGDVHPEGNPHFSTDPHNIIPIANYITEKLSKLDEAHAQEYHHNLTKFSREWKKFLKIFDAQMQTCKGKKVVQYHELYNYILRRYDIDAVATIEPLPGISPSSKHTIALIRKIKREHIKTILQDPYHESKTAHFIAAKTDAKVMIVPHDVGAVSGTDTLRTFYETMAKRLCH